MLLGELNDGNGVRLRTALPEIAWTLRDGTSSSDAGFAAIDFTSLLNDDGTGTADLKIADVLRVINEVAPDKLRAEIEAPFRKQASGGSPPTIKEYQKMIAAAGEMKGLMTGLAFDVSAAQYKELEKFLDTLAGEARGRIEKRTTKQPAKSSK